jgi:hypothetical protein
MFHESVGLRFSLRHAGPRAKRVGRSRDARECYPCAESDSPQGNPTWMVPLNLSSR